MSLLRSSRSVEVLMSREQEVSEAWVAQVNLSGAEITASVKFSGPPNYAESLICLLSPSCREAIPATTA